ncbi:rho GTPase-activating protein SYDE2-like isoform X1 [Paramormyrops kingsleyae]|uniref:rho GTPase-activating protein SYDE2-like isoform X1 n=1 Tax=Paramormyrops kingsleyae TaxID=1676925 RepID=UPI003B96DB05
MADPLRRTILAKLRGKKSRKAAAVGGFGVATFVDNREGKDGVLCGVDEQTPDKIITELNDLPDIMRDKEGCLNIAFESGAVRSNCENAVVKNVSPRDDTCVHLNVGSGDYAWWGVDLNHTGRVHKRRLGVSDQNEMQTRASHGNRINYFNELELDLSKDACTESSEMMRENSHPLYPSGPPGPILDLDGVGLCRELTPVQTTYHYVEMSGNGVQGKEIGVGVHQCGEHQGNPVASNAEKDADLLCNLPRMPYTDIAINGAQIYQFLAVGTVAENHQVSNNPSGDYRVRSFQNTSLFPTDLVVSDKNVGTEAEMQWQNLVGSDDGDYYDNDNLPFYNPLLCAASGPNSDQVEMNRKQDETDGFKVYESYIVRTQFKEACVLLISAMQGINLDNEVAVNGLGCHVNLTSCNSQESLCSEVSSKVVDCDAFSSGEAVPPESHSVRFHDGENDNLCLRRSLASKSFEVLPTENPPPLRRSVSDGVIEYHQNQYCRLERKVPLALMRENDWGMSSGLVSLANQVPCDGEGGDSLLLEMGDNCPLNETSGPVNSAKSQGTEHGLLTTQDVLKPNGVTVNKIQEWMQKGRMLSSEMKHRITGSVLHEACGDSPPQRSCPRFLNRAKAAPRVTGSQKRRTVARGQGTKQPAYIKNVRSSVTDTQEAIVSRHNETNEKLRLLTAITVSKKRHWFHHSTSKNPVSEEGSVSVEPDVAHVGSEPEASQPAPTPLHKAPHLQPASANSDPQRGNAADRAGDGGGHLEEEGGEIWYNPIPEDEDPTLVGGPADVDSVRHSQEGCSCEKRLVDGSLLVEPAELRRRILTRRSAEDSLPPKVTAPDGIEAGVSPPSSPNPWKKGSSINWSFPDRIKSPRTMRKLSMKMKLPELSRKLNVKGVSSSQTDPLYSSPKVTRRLEGGPNRSHLSPGGGQTARNVISRYHLDSSVFTRNNDSQKTRSGSKAASKGGYLSDGDSPELVTKSGKQRDKDCPASNGSKLHGPEMDVNSFRHYSFSAQPKCSQYISGIMSLHFFGAEDLKPPRVDSRSVYCAIQVDSVNKARTAMLTCKTAFLDMDHAFNIELENAQQLKLVVFSWESSPRRHRVCCHGTVALPTLFRVTRSHQLAVQLEPRGVIYVKLGLIERWPNSLDAPDGGQELRVFRVDASLVVEREASGFTVPLVVKKCITEIEKRGCQMVGLYRLCGSAAVKKELREAFERDSQGVDLSEDRYPDINVITGVLKDYLRELPTPLISDRLYEAVLDAMAKRPLKMGAMGCENDPADSLHATGLLAHLPPVEKAALQMLLNHLKLVASHQDVNRMTCQNLAVCFGPVLLGQRQEAACRTNRTFADCEELASALHFKKHIEVLHYLLQLWPVVDPNKTPSPQEEKEEVSPTSQCIRRRKERPQALNLSEAEVAGVLRPKPGRLDSPSNRYAGDWSLCRDRYLQPSKEGDGEDADYDNVPWEEEGTSEEGKAAEEDEVDDMEVEEKTSLPDEPDSNILSTPNDLTKDNEYQGYMKIREMNSVLNNTLNLNELQQSIDNLIGSLERELNKNKLAVGY